MMSKIPYSFRAYVASVAAYSSAIAAETVLWVVAAAALGDSQSTAALEKITHLSASLWMWLPIALIIFVLVALMIAVPLAITGYSAIKLLQKITNPSSIQFSIAGIFAVFMMELAFAYALKGQTSPWPWWVSWLYTFISIMLSGTLVGLTYQRIALGKMTHDVARKAGSRD